MNIKATLSDVTINFTPDEIDRIFPVLKQTVEHIEELNSLQDYVLPDNTTSPS